jgi:hypothetical protein
MNKIGSIILVSVFLAILSGCTSIKSTTYGGTGLWGKAERVASAPVEKYEGNISKYSKIGIVNLIGNDILHRHLGTTIVNNFENTYSVEWDLSGHIKKSLYQKLSEKGLQVKELQLSEVDKEILSNTLSQGFINLSLNDKGSNLVKILGINSDVDIIIMLKPYNRAIGGGIKSVGGFGIRTDSFVGMGGNAGAFANISASIILAREGRLFAHFQQEGESYGAPNPYPSNIKNITETESESYRPILTDLADELIEKTVDNFSSTQ